MRPPSPTHTHTHTPAFLRLVCCSVDRLALRSVMLGAVRLRLPVVLQLYIGPLGYSGPHPHLRAALIGACRTKKTWPVSFPPEELRKRLTPIQFHVTQERGTESAFTGEFAHHKEDGTYTCVVCGALLFNSNTKFDSGSGWPSFSDLVKEDSITRVDDFSYGMHRVETTCSQCGAHLGHLFDDGPKPSGKRYCINSASLAFRPAGASSSSGPSGETGEASGSD